MRLNLFRGDTTNECKEECNEILANALSGELCSSVLSNLFGLMSLIQGLDKGRCRRSHCSCVKVKKDKRHFYDEVSDILYKSKRKETQRTPIQNPWNSLYASSLENSRPIFLERPLLYVVAHMHVLKSVGNSTV